MILGRRGLRGVKLVDVVEPQLDVVVSTSLPLIDAPMRLLGLVLLDSHVSEANNQ